MAVLRFLSHPQVRVSADIAVPRWGLTEQGRRRVEEVCTQSWISAASRLVSSGETKALETAAIIADATGLLIEVRGDLHENDRSATGFVPPGRFDELANAFFADPEHSIEGWETARDAQARVVQATADLVHGQPGDVLVSGHGGVGTLLLCHLLGASISRKLDQHVAPAAPGGGNYWAFDCAVGRVVHGWRPIEHKPSDA